AAFVVELRRQETARKGIVDCRSNLAGFIRRLTESTGEELSATVVTPLDIRDYQRFSHTNQGCTLLTVHCRLAARRRLSKTGLDDWSGGRRTNIKYKYERHTVRPALLQGNRKV